MNKDVSGKARRFPSHWRVLPFLDAVRDSSRGNPKIKAGDYKESGCVPIVDQGQKIFGGFTDDMEAICNCELPTIIFGDHTRAFKFIEQPFALGADGTKVLEPIEELDKKFLYHYLSQLELKSAGYSRHFKFLKETLIPVPPMQEQKRIASILDKADTLRRKRQQAIELADHFLRSVFLEMFGDPVSNPKGWNEAPLSTGITRIESGWSAKGDNRPAGEGQIGVLKISSVTSGKFIPGENKVVDESTVPAGKKLLKPRAGDLLFSRANTRDLVAATAIVDRDYDNLFLPDKLWKIQTNEQLLPEFLNYLLWHQRMRDRLRSQATGTSGSMLNISKKKFEETSAIFPPIEKQRKFVDIYRKARAISEKYSSSSDLTEELFASASQKAFSSQL